MKIERRDDKVYLKFESLEEAEVSMYNALSLLERAGKSGLDDSQLSDEIIDFLNENGWPEEDDGVSQDG